MSSSSEKGNKSERYVQQLYEKQGYIVHRAYASLIPGPRPFTRSNDIFGIFDLIAKKAGYKTKWIQVTTTSGKSARVKKIKAAGEFYNEMDSIELWCKKKEVGFIAYRLCDGEFQEFLRIDKGRLFVSGGKL